MAAPRRNFAIIYEIKNVKKLPKTNFSVGQNYWFYGLKWRISLMRNEQDVTINLLCDEEKTLQSHIGWNVDVCMEVVLASKYPCKTLRATTQHHRFTGDDRIYKCENIAKWSDLNNVFKGFLERDTLRIELNVQITHMGGLRRIMKNFDESNREFSDVELLADGQRFFVSKLHMASHSTFLNSMFNIPMNEAGGNVFDCGPIHADVFQDLLELLYGEDTISMFNLEALLDLADYLGTETATRRLFAFIEKNKHNINQKYYTHLANKYDSKEMQDRTLTLVCSAHTLKEALPASVELLKPEFTIKILERVKQFSF
ncbi:hypothetical protein L5515_002191 [Caenorhabditis briggsae]|uniref:BTB domain-containing protein n=1 Tax=Caenorhabditis briggsae TaxID=6238 RepID=A0AAE9E827_CAEBR|nr:hypothetical protein L5515_002191 [Caenorhabditis briggsae]